MYDLPFYADKTLLSLVWFSEILSLSNYFLSPYSFKKEINHFPTKHRGLGNSYKVTIIFATLVQLKVEYRNQFCRNCKRAKAFRLWIGEKREFIFMQRIALLEVASFLNSHRHFEIQSCLIWEYIPFCAYIQVAIRCSICFQFEETSMRCIFLSLDHHTIISPNSP